ncbi:MAG TPA: tetratricopeptide repeat protein, partial [Sphingomicrobium sp.]|nr:tetratricopeptide repeat protein [Sphingomicrobium sp.]
MQSTIIADPKVALTQARQLLASDPAAAEALARRLLASDPGNAVVLRLLAQALRRTGQPEQASEAELQAIEASTRNPMHRAAATALQAGNAAQAKSLLQKLLAADPNDVLALTMLGHHWTGVNE